MRFVIQRVSSASVTVEGEVVGSVEQGFLVLVGIRDDDTREIADRLVSKLCKLRIFEDADGKSNLSLQDVGGSLLMVSQFSLFADCKKGNRPSYIRAASGDFAREMYEYVLQKAKEEIPCVEAGIFGADMQVSLVNDGPFTILYDSDDMM